MRAIVTKKNGETDTFGNVMGIKADPETYRLTVDYAISNDRYPHSNFEKVYDSSAWKSVEIVAEAPRWNDEQSKDWATPEGPIK